ncbi:MAG: WbqC family protein [Bacteroidota bacterium]
MQKINRPVKMAPKLLIELHYLPCVQYLSKWLLHEQILVEAHENYTKGSYRNRCQIAGANGPLRLSIPLQSGKNEQQPIREVRIAHRDAWAKKHWRAIRSAYGKSPYFEHYAHELAPLFEKTFTFLFDWNWTLLQTLVPLLGLPNKLQLSEAFHRQINPQECLDFRNTIGPTKRNQGPDSYFQPSPYPQVFTEKSGFIPNLSALDLLFCAGPQSYSILEASIIQTYEQ